MTTADDTPIPDFLQRSRLDGRGYVVVGAGAGMGRQTCHALAQAGAARVVCVDVDDLRAKEVADEIGVGVPWVGDVTSRDGAVQLAEDAERILGRIDGYVDIVGNAQGGNFFELSDEVWASQFDIVFRHAYLLAQELGRRMVSSGGGSVVYIGSVSGMHASPLSAAYGASKAALHQLVQSLAVELGPYNLRVNCVAPGCILTPKVTGQWSDEMRDSMASITPLGALGESSDIASLVWFFLSDLSKHMTGLTIPVGGGVDARGGYSRATFPVRGKDEVDRTSIQGFGRAQL